MGIFKKICVVLTNRSEYAKVKMLINKIRNDSNFELKILATGSLCSSRYGNPLNEIIQDGFSPDVTIKSMLDGDCITDIVKSASLQMIEECLYFQNNKPDLAVLIGDRWEIVPVAFILSLFCIPIVHIQGGEISGTIDDITRAVITKYSHIHFVSNDICKQRVIGLGELEYHVYATGCPSLDYITNLDTGTDVDMEKLKPFLKVPLSISKKDNYFIILVHPDVADFNANIESIFDAVSSFPNKKLWFYPNNDPYNSKILDFLRCSHDIFKFKHLPMDLFITLMAHCKCLIGNSSSGIRESSSFGIPTINIGQRQRGRDRNPNVIDVPYDCDMIKNAIKNALKMNFPHTNIYGDSNASCRIINILKSYNSLHYKNISI